MLGPRLRASSEVMMVDPLRRVVDDVLAEGRHIARDFLQPIAPLQCQFLKKLGVPLRLTSSERNQLRLKPILPQNRNQGEILLLPRLWQGVSVEVNVPD